MKKIFFVIVAALMVVGTIIFFKTQETNNTIPSATLNEPEINKELLEDESKHVDLLVDEPSQTLIVSNVDLSEDVVDNEKETKIVQKEIKKEEKLTPSSQSIKQENKEDEDNINEDSKLEEDIEDEKEEEIIYPVVEIVPVVKDEEEEEEYTNPNYVDENGVTHIVGAAYWDEQGRGSVDPDAEIPDWLPPGAVFVTEISDEEYERLKNEYGLEGN